MCPPFFFWISALVGPEARDVRCLMKTTSCQSKAGSQRMAAHLAPNVGKARYGGWWNGSSNEVSNVWRAPGPDARNKCKEARLPESCRLPNVRIVENCAVGVDFVILFRRCHNCEGRRTTTGVQR